MLLLLLCIWNGMVAFLSGVGRIFVQDEGNWTAWVSSIWERKLILGRLKQLQLLWALPASVVQKDCLGWQWEHFLCHREKPQHCFSLSGRDVLEVYSACGVLVWQGPCRPSARTIAGRGEEWSCGSAASLGLGSHGFNSWLCCCLPVGRAWSGTLSNSASQLLIAWYHIILKPQPICSKMFHITWQPTALLVSSMGNLQGDKGPNQNPESPRPPSIGVWILQLLWNWKWGVAATESAISDNVAVVKLLSLHEVFIKPAQYLTVI